MRHHQGVEGFDARPPGRAPIGGGDPYAQVERLLAEGASLDELEGYLQRRTASLDEEQRSARWLEDWHAREHLGSIPARIELGPPG